jgi:mannose-1-phosphate guanylyltransferase/phosphomannomutase
MRKMSEDSIEQDTSFIDGVKVTFADAWVLVLPDQSRPVAHVIAEAADAQRADTLIKHYRVKVATWIEELRES